MELDDLQVILDEKGRVVRTSKYHPNKSREVLILDDFDDDQMKAEKPKRKYKKRRKKGETNIENHADNDV